MNKGSKIFLFRLTVAMIITMEITMIVLSHVTPGTELGNVLLGAGVGITMGILALPYLLWNEFH